MGASEAHAVVTICLVIQRSRTACLKEWSSKGMQYTVLLHPATSLFANASYTLETDAFASAIGQHELVTACDWA